MIVGVLRLVFHIPHARSLKEKRSVARKFRDRIRARFDVSIAEVEAQERLSPEDLEWVFGRTAADFLGLEKLPAAV